jgi:hypothetical protein
LTEAASAARRRDPCRSDRTAIVADPSSSAAALSNRRPPDETCHG